MMTSSCGEPGHHSTCVISLVLLLLLATAEVAVATNQVRDDDATRILLLRFDRDTATAGIERNRVEADGGLSWRRNQLRLEAGLRHSPGDTRVEASPVTRSSVEKGLVAHVSYLEATQRDRGGGVPSWRLTATIDVAFADHPLCTRCNAAEEQSHDHPHAHGGHRHPAPDKERDAFGTIWIPASAPRIRISLFRDAQPLLQMDGGDQEIDVNGNDHFANKAGDHSRRDHSRRVLGAQATSFVGGRGGQPNITMNALQEVGLFQRTVTFVSSGYRAVDADLFSRDVRRALDTLRTPASSPIQLDADPWPRYFTLLNLYAVFEPSDDTGASKPVGPGHVCSNNRTFCSAVVRRNNLECTYGTPLPQHVSCSSALVLNLASYAPKADVVVVLLNDAEYGASGRPGIAVVNNGPHLSPLLVHELGHAVGHLADEYSYGFSESGGVVLANCAASAEAAVDEWAEWRGAGKADAVATRGCSFDNYFRSTAEQCLMRSATSPSMCSVCKERMVETFFASPFALDSPRCPPDGFEVLLRSGSESVPLSINHHFATANRDVSVVWTLPDGSTIAGLPSITLRGSELANRVASNVSVNITDLSPLVRPSRIGRGRKSYIGVFRLRRDDNTTGGAVVGCPAETHTCTSSSGNEITYCGRCLVQGGCRLRPTIRAGVLTVPSVETLEQEEAVVIVVAVVIAAGWVVTAFAVIGARYHAMYHPQEVLAIRGSDLVLNVLSAVLGLVAFWSAAALLLAVVYYEPRVHLFGEPVKISVFVAGACSLAATLLAQVGAVLRHHVLLVASSVVLVSVSLVFFGAGMFGVYIGRNVRYHGTIDWMRDVWYDSVKVRPRLVCDLANGLQCSGFDYSCAPIMSSACPANCPANANAAACLPPLQQFLETYLLPLGIASTTLGFFFVVLAVLCLALHFTLLRLRQNALARRSYRRDPRAPVVTVTGSEMESLKEEFHKADINRNGLLEGPEIVAFLRATLGEVTPHDEEAIGAASRAAGGGLPLHRIIELYFPTMYRNTDPRLLTVEEASMAQNMPELQRLQFAKMERFMAASGTLSPESLRDVYRSHTALGSATANAEFIDLVRAAARSHAGSEDDRMCAGISPHELEGLRCAWVALHPSIAGPLSDAELDMFYQWTHGEALVSQEHFVRWRTALDARRSGRIGWAEFCMPFARRALLAQARRQLALVGRAVDPEEIPAAQAMEEFGEAVVKACLLPHERSVPVERLVALSLNDV